MEGNDANKLLKDVVVLESLYCMCVFYIKKIIVTPVVNCFHVFKVVMDLHYEVSFVKQCQTWMEFVMPSAISRKAMKHPKQFIYSCELYCH